MGNISKERILLPRVIYGNRGDILSRWGLINGLYTIGKDDVYVFAHREDDLPERIHDHFDPYGKFHNLRLSPNAKTALKQCDRILWGGGLDMTDESSLSKLMYILVLFSYYRMLGKEIDCVFQGAGPLITRTGKILSRQILKRVSKFIVRDEYAYSLLHKLNPKVEYFKARDAIFLPGFEQALANHTPSSIVEQYCQKDRNPLVAINIRRWFHFSSDLIPFQLAKKRYESRGLDQMKHLLDIYADLITKLRKQFNARILLVSAYNPGIYSWEDDMKWLQLVKAFFPLDDAVCLVDQPMPMTDYMALMARVDLAVSMRLHSSLAAIRFGNPAVNISYAPKGIHAFNLLGLENCAFNINNVMQDPTPIWERIEDILKDGKEQRKKITSGVQESIDINLKALSSLFGE